MENLHRRDFLRLSAAIAAFASVPASAAAEAGQARPGMLTGIAIAQDCASVCSSLEGIEPGVKAALTRQLAIVALGDIIPSGGARLISLLDSKLLDSRLLDSREDKRQAVALGYVISRAASHHWAPKDGGPESLVYQDAHILREVMQSPHSQSAESMQKLLDTIDMRLRIGIHTFEPDAQDVENWIVRLIDWDLRMEEGYRKYAAAFASPDPAKLRKYVESVNLYDRKDPLIGAASQLRAGARIPQAELRRSIAAEGQSLYGKALRQALKDVTAVSDYVGRRLDSTQLKAALNLSVAN